MTALAPDTPERQWLADFGQREGYAMWKIISDTEYAAVTGMIYTTAIVRGTLGNDQVYNDRWCYTTLGHAAAAFLKWDGTGEPDGWIRNPTSGRRRSDGHGHIDENGREVPAGEVYVRW